MFETNTEQLQERRQNCIHFRQLLDLIENALRKRFQTTHTLFDRLLLRIVDHPPLRALSPPIQHSLQQVTANQKQRPRIRALKQDLPVRTT